MGNADGAIIIETEIDQRGAIKGVAELKVILGGAGKQFEQTVNSMTSSMEGMNLKVNTDEAEQEIGEVVSEVEQLNEELEDGPRIHIWNAETESEVEEGVEEVREAVWESAQAIEEKSEETAEKSKNIFKRMADGFQSAYTRFVSALTLPGKEAFGGNPEINIKTDKARDRVVELTGRIEMLKQKLKEMDAQGTTFGFEEYDKTYQDLKKLEPELNAYKKKLEQASEGSKKLAKNTKQVNQSVNNSSVSFKKGLKKLLAYGFGIRSVYMLFRKLRSAIGEGIKNLVQVDKETNNAVSGMVSSFSQVKNSIAAAFAPIITMVAPYITRLMDMLNAAISKIGQFFAALSGKGTFTKAVKVQQDYAKSLNGTTTSAKKASKALYAFDELNVLQKDEDTGTAAADMFKTEEITEEAATMAQGFKDFFSPVIAAFENLKAHAQPVIEKLGNAVAWLRENVLEPLGSWTINDAIPAFFDALGGALDLVAAVAEKLGDWFSVLWDKFLAPAAAWVGDAIVSFFETLGKVLTDISENETAVTILSGVAVAILAVVAAIELWNIAQAILNGLLAISPITWIILAIVALIAIIVLCITYWDQIKAVIEKVWESIKTKVTNTINKIKTTLATTTANIKQAWNDTWTSMKEKVLEIFDGIWNGIKKVINSIIGGIEWMVNSVINGINKMIDALNSLSFDVPDWLGGGHFGFNIPNLATVSIPRLATGTVVPRSAGEFAAILGDNNRETEVVSPLSTMKQAFMEALDSRGGQEVNVYISAEGDMDALVRELNFRISKEQSRVGTNFTKVVRA